MFTGIVQMLRAVASVTPCASHSRLVIAWPEQERAGLTTGASVAIDGVCLTVVEKTTDTVAFDVIPETLRCTTLGTLRPGSRVNLERSLRFGDEVGGHILSGHVRGVATVDRIETQNETYALFLRVPSEWLRFIFHKGFIAINGASLTVVDVAEDVSENVAVAVAQQAGAERGIFSVHLIPETLRQTNLGDRHPGDGVNIEIDSQTQAIVETVDRHLAGRVPYCTSSSKKSESTSP